MDKVNDPSKARPGRDDSASDAPSASLDLDVSAETSPRTPLQQRIEAQRAQLLQAHGVLRCLAYVAANLVNKSVEELDSLRIGPLIGP